MAGARSIPALPFSALFVEAIDGVQGLLAGAADAVTHTSLDFHGKVSP